jgi:hypothetical protein
MNESPPLPQVEKEETEDEEEKEEESESEESSSDEEEYSSSNQGRTNRDNQIFWRNSISNGRPNSTSKSIRRYNCADSGNGSSNIRTNDNSRNISTSSKDIRTDSITRLRISASVASTTSVSGNILYLVSGNNAARYQDS